MTAAPRISLPRPITHTPTLLSLILCLIFAHGFSLPPTNIVTCPTNTGELDELRGGALTTESDIQPRTRTVILEFLSSSSDTANDFHIQGWRWHFMSLIRDSKRLQRLANYLSEENRGMDGLDALESASDYLVNFNMAGLHRVESTLFVRWLRENLCDANVVVVGKELDGKEISQAFGEVIDRVDEYRIQTDRIGKELYHQSGYVTDTSKSLLQREQSLLKIVELTSQLSERLQHMRILQETLLVPAVASIVPSGKQKSFNNRVLLNLGILESRIHLVGMHDAVWESGEEVEKMKFEREIPYVARIMIERWRKSIYAPRAGTLDYGLN